MRTWSAPHLRSLLLSTAAIPALLLGCAGSASPSMAQSQPGFSIPLPADGGSARATAAAPGADFIDVGGKAYQVSDMLYLQTEGGAGASEFSYGVYALDLDGQQPEQVLVDSYFDMQPVSAGSAVWIGLGDYSAGRWEWHGPFAESPLVLSCAEPRFKSPADTVVVAVVVTGGSDCYLAGLEANPNILDVGDGYPYSRLEDATAAASPGSWILAHWTDGGPPYSNQPALLVDKPRLHFRGAPYAVLDGQDFNYTGAGSVPRAIFQFDPGADGCSVEGFWLMHARNDTSNGAGVRINQANDVLIRNCLIVVCDMGIMSNGSLADDSARGQRIEYCTISANGDFDNPGYSHNLYLGGTSVRVLGCHIERGRPGHNFKSRAHFTEALFNYVHHSGNREFDLVDDGENTATAGSHAVLIGNVIVKDPDCPGNRAVIHFGQDGGNDHQGTLWLVHNTIVTPFINPIVTLSAPGANCMIYNNIVSDGGSGQSGQVLVSASGGAQLGSSVCRDNWLAHGQTIEPTLTDASDNFFAASNQQPPFTDPFNPDDYYADYSLASAEPSIVDQATGWEALSIPTAPGLPPIDRLYQYRPLAWTAPRPEDGAADIGAYEYTP